MFKKLHLFVVAMLAVTLLSACGGSEGESGDEVENEINSSGQASVGELFGGGDDDEPEAMELAETDPDENMTASVSDCAPIDDPVCSNGTTYENACLADEAGETEWTRGSC